ncbi:MAG: hypothetical protein LBJ61_05905 [Deltaproteobacteria bacterium]|nr:hypothetical protein [Deltaproteobacteria bacterium]
MARQSYFPPVDVVTQIEINPDTFASFHEYMNALLKQDYNLLPDAETALNAAFSFSAGSSELLQTAPFGAIALAYRYVALYRLLLEWVGSAYTDESASNPKPSLAATLKAAAVCEMVQYIPEEFYGLNSKSAPGDPVGEAPSPYFELNRFMELAETFNRESPP